MKKMILLIVIALCTYASTIAKDFLWGVPSINHVISVKFSPDEKYVYAVTNHGVQKHDANTGELISTFKGYITSGTSSGYYFCKFSHDFSKIVMTSSESIYIWDILKEELQWQKTINTLTQPAVNWSQIPDISANGNYIYFFCYDKLDSNNLMVYNVNEQKVERIFNYKGKPYMIAASPNGRYLAILDANKGQYPFKLTLVDAVSLKPIIDIETSMFYVRFMTFSSDNSKLIFQTDYVKIYDIENRKIRSTGPLLNSTSGTSHWQCISRDARYFAFLTDNGFNILSLDDGEIISGNFSIDGNRFDISKKNDKVIVGGWGSLGLYKINLDPVSVAESNIATPNPFKFLSSSSKLDIIPDGSCQITGIEIANSAGKIVMAQGIEGNQFSIDISALASGAYYCRIKCGEKVYTEAFAVTR